MYSVFLVDDEIVVREGIRSNICWDQENYSLVGEAPDGEMALSIMKDLKPDILITDIKMPFMDGLTLARIIRKTQPWVKIIILSGHDEFQYAKEAISIGVEEYLLKPFSSSELMEVLAKVARRIEEEQKDLTSIENLRKQVLSSADILRDRWLCDLTLGHVSFSEAIEQARDYGIDLIAHGYLVMVIKLFVPPEHRKELLSAGLMIKAQLSQRDDVISFSPNTEKQVFIVKCIGQDPLEETGYALAQGLKYEILKNTHCAMAVGIGPSVERIGEIPISYESADSVLTYMEKKDQYLILGINDIPQEDISLITLDGDSIAGRLKYAGLNDIEDLMEQYKVLLGENQTNFAFISYYLLGDIIVAATRIIEDLGEDIHKVIPSFFQKERIDLIVSSREMFCLEVRKLIKKVVTFRDSKGKGRYNEMIKKANQYIDTHYADQDISLHTVADYVNVSPNHFSTVYSQETGENFIEYLTSVRINRAKYLLLTSKMKSADIAYDAGFNDPHYFSFIFKKNVGLSPRDFRSEKNILSED